MKLSKTYPALIIWRTVLVFLVLAVCRIVFVIYNFKSFGGFSTEELPRLFLGALRFDCISFIYAMSLWLILSLLPHPWRFNRIFLGIVHWVYTLSCFFLIIVTNLSDCIYFHYTDKRFSAEEMFFASNENTSNLILKFGLENWYLILTGILLVYLIHKGYNKKAEYSCSMRSIKSYTVAILLLLATVFVCIIGIRGGLSRMARPTAVPYSQKFATSARKANIVLSNPFCIFRTYPPNSYSSIPKFFSEEELDKIYFPEHRPATDPAHCFCNKNVVIFVMESMSAEHSKYLCPDVYPSPEETGYTPFMDSLMQRGYSFHRMYANGKRSIQALPSIWSSIPSLQTPFMLLQESLGESKPLPRILSDKGYYTAFFCGSERGSMGFDAYAQAAGFKNFFSMEDYVKKYSKNDFDGYWGIWDDKFLHYMGEEISTMPEPFLASVFTLSSHHPFVVPQEKENSLPKGNTKIQKCVRFVDDGVRAFFEDNKHKTWFKNTVFLFVADHVSSEKYAEKTKHTPGDYHILSFLYYGDESLQGDNYDLMSQIDLMPTMLGLMNNDTPYFGFGRDIINEKQDDPIIIVYDNGYKAFTNNYVFLFPVDHVTEIFAIDDINCENNLIDIVNYKQDEKRIQAFIQQYYNRVQHQDFLAR